MDSTTTIQNLVNGFSNKFSNLSTQLPAPKPSFWRQLLGFNLGINWSQPTWDLFLALFFIITAVFYCISLGRDRVTAFMISTYIALAVVKTVPYMAALENLLAQTGIAAVQTCSFLIVFLVLFYLLSRSTLIDEFSDISGGIFQTLLFSILQTGLLTSIILSLLPTTVVDNFSIFVQLFFISEPAQFLWIILPIMALVFIRGRR